MSNKRECDMCRADISGKTIHYSIEAREWGHNGHLCYNKQVVMFDLCQSCMPKKPLYCSIVGAIKKVIPWI